MSQLHYDPFPKYLQIRVVISRWLKTLELGDMLPTEQQLADHFSVSRLTMRQALQKFEEDGVIARRAGVGTWLVKMPYLSEDDRLTGPIESFSGLGLKINAHTIRNGVIPTTPEISAKLKLGDDKEVYEIHRLREVDDAPLLWLEVYLPLALGEKIRHGAADGLFLPVLRRLHDPNIVEKYQAIEAISAPPEYAERLKIDVNSPLLSVNRVFVDSTGKPVIYFKTRFRADRYFYTVSLPALRARP